MLSTLKVNVPINTVVLLAQINEKVTQLLSRPLLRSVDICELLNECVANITVCMKWAKDYDYSDAIQANGYWTMALYIKKLLDYGLKCDDNITPIIPTIIFFNRWFQAINVSTNGHGTIPSHTDSVLRTKLTVDLMNEYLSSPNAIAAIYGPLCGIQTPKAGKMINVFTSGFSLLNTSNIYEAVRCLASKTYRGALMVNAASCLNVTLFKRFIYIFELNVTKIVFPYLCFPVVTVNKVITVNRQSTWNIGFNHDGKIELTSQPVIRHRDEGVRCKYVLSGDVGQQTSLLFHVHGGAFISLTPEMHEMYTRRWARQLPGIPILSVDYVLAPENKFPVALQQLLDVYMWLTNDDCQDEVISGIGFIPDRIVLVGDSAGAQIAMALLLVLNDIRNERVIIDLNSNDKVVMVAGIVSIYPAFNVNAEFVPSMFMGCVDTMLTLMLVYFVIIDAYAPISNATKLLDSFWSTSNGNSNASILPSVVNSIKWLNPFRKVKPACGWYACSKPELMSRFAAFGDNLEHPYLSTLKYQKFDQLKDVSCHLIGLVNDIFLDQSVDMAKKWKGNCTLDVVDELSHAFLNYLPFSSLALEGSDLVLSRIKQAFDI